MNRSRSSSMPKSTRYINQPIHNSTKITSSPHHNNRKYIHTSICVDDRLPHSQNIKNNHHAYQLNFHRRSKVFLMNKNKTISTTSRELSFAKKNLAYLKNDNFHGNFSNTITSANGAMNIGGCANAGFANIGGVGFNSINSQHSSNNRHRIGTNLQIPIKRNSLKRVIDKRVVDKRNSYANSKYYVKRILADTKPAEDENTNATQVQNNSARKSSVVKISDDSFFNTSKDKLIVLDNLRESNEDDDDDDQNENEDGQSKKLSRSNSKRKETIEKQNTCKIAYFELERENTTLKAPDFLDPNWIPSRVRESLLDLHRKFYKKSPLQLSHISKSDSNLKSEYQRKLSKKIIENRKLLSLQSTETLDRNTYV
jgi:hypothetical protein